MNQQEWQQTLSQSSSTDNKSPIATLQDDPDTETAQSHPPIAKAYS